MNPVAWKLVDFGFTLALAGLERINVVGKVRAMEEAGASQDEITDALQKMAEETESKAQNEINKG